MEERLGLVASSLPELHEKLALPARKAARATCAPWTGSARKDANALRSRDSMAPRCANGRGNGNGPILDAGPVGQRIDWERPCTVNANRAVSACRLIPSPASVIGCCGRREPAGIGVLECIASAGATKHLEPARSTIQQPLRWPGVLSSPITCVRESRVLPGVAQLEMARFAASSAGWRHHAASERRCMGTSVLAGEDGLELHLSLSPEDNGDIRYEIHAEPLDGDVDRSTAVAS
jgi:hypothetical protein